MAAWAKANLPHLAFEDARSFALGPRSNLTQAFEARLRHDRSNRKPHPTTRRANQTYLSYYINTATVPMGVAVSTPSNQGIRSNPAIRPEVLLNFLDQISSRRAAICQFLRPMSSRVQDVPR